MTNGADELVNGPGGLLPELEGESRSGLETIDLGPMLAPDPTRGRRRQKVTTPDPLTNRTTRYSDTIPHFMDLGS